MMKFKSSSARTKFKSKLRARVKFKALAAFAKVARHNVPQAQVCAYSSSAKILAARSRIASSNAVIAEIVNLNYKELKRGEI